MEWRKETRKETDERGGMVAAQQPGCLVADVETCGVGTGGVLVGRKWLRLRILGVLW